MSQRASSPVDSDTESQGIPPSTLLLIFSCLAESVWGYMLLGYLVMRVTPSATLDPLFVLVPYGLAILTTLLITVIWGAAGSYSERLLAGHGEGPARLVSRLSWLIMPAAAVAIAILYLVLYTGTMLGISWWEMYRSWAIVGSSWLSSFLEDANGATERAQTLGWLWGLGLVVWFRGTYVARGPVDFSSTVSRFLSGLVILVAFVLWAGIDSVGQLGISSLLGAYLLFGLAAVATTRLETALERRAGAMDVNWRWRSLLLSSLLVAVGFGLVFLVLPVLTDVAIVIRDWLVNVALPALGAVLGWIIHLLGLDQPPEAASPPPDGGVEQAPRMAENPLSPPEWLAAAARLFFNLSWISMILYAIYLAFSYRFRRKVGRSAGTAHRERMPWNLRAWLLGLLLGLLGLLASRWPSLSRWIARLASGEQAGLTVRNLYRKLLAWGASRGSARETWTTPTEYEALLSARWPGLAEEFRVVTASYVRARYGGIVTPQEELEAVLDGWLRIEALDREAARAPAESASA